MYSIDSPESNRILIDPSLDADLLRMATTDYLISEFQKTYFVMKSFSLLESLTPERIVWAAKRAMQLPHYTWREIAPGDQVINVGTIAMGTNEKYFRLMANAPIDECVSRAALRNLRLVDQGFDQERGGFDLKLPPAKIPQAALDWYHRSPA